MRFLVVEDDPQVASFIRRGLREEQYTVDLAVDGEEAIFVAGIGEYDLIILDWRLPKRNGLEVLEALRSDGVSVPILMLTARDELKDKVSGFNAGADDYLTKPFSFEELLARIRALLRRRGDLVPTFMRVADLELDCLRHRVTRGGQRLDLTNREYGLLEYIMRNAGRVVSRTMLAEHVWEHDFDPLSNVIDVHVAPGCGARSTTTSLPSCCRPCAAAVTSCRPRMNRMRPTSGARPPTEAGSSGDSARQA